MRDEGKVLDFMARRHARGMREQDDQLAIAITKRDRGLPLVDQDRRALAFWDAQVAASLKPVSEFAIPAQGLDADTFWAYLYAQFPRSGNDPVGDLAGDFFTAIEIYGLPSGPPTLGTLKVYLGAIGLAMAAPEVLDAADKAWAEFRAAGCKAPAVRRTGA